MAWTDLNTLPVGTKFYVNNGAWHGAIVFFDGKKYVHVFATKQDHELTGSDELDIEILPNDWSE